ncbi:MAG: TetR/AcrR family transcriptional regulator [Candidatus Omnitrophica bacterium]|nr:TetR/AcrR family transcriptional regulator [Candidatus Omnitrophota bacterium]
MISKKMGGTISRLKIQPKKRNRKESTQRILQAGLEVFSEVGYDAATTKMISKRAGLNESLIQRYFKSKSNLLVEVTYSCIDALSKEKPYPPAETPQEEIYRFLVNKLENVSKNIKFFRVIISRVLVDLQMGTELQKRKPLDLFFIERLSLFQKKGLIRTALDINELVLLITNQSFAITIMELILSNKSIESCKKQLLAFSKNLANGVGI